MTERNREIIKMALIYFLSNRDEFIEACTEGEEEGTPFEFNGVECDPPTEDEIAEALIEFQDVL